MKIGITLHPYGEKKPAGLGRAVFEIVKAMLEVDSENEYSIFLKNPGLKPDLPGSKWKSATISPDTVRVLDACIFNTPVMPLWYGILGKAKNSVVIAYDFAYLRKIEVESWKSEVGKKILKLVHRYALKKADLIISISEATKRDLIEIFKIPEEKIKVIYLGFNDICVLPKKEISGLPEKFFLFVGAIKERKNVLGIVEAFNLFKNSSNFQHKLVIAGNGSGEYFEKVKKLASMDSVFLGQVSDNELSYLYQTAEALVYPSFVEGFGIPVLEGQACALPVVTSNTFSLPEVAGDGAIIVDPNKPLEIAEAMKKICQDPLFRQKLIENGMENSKKFSWHKTAQEILQVL
ncbi:MAG: glycosyltransferase family 1 protein [Patescibacteria group bacterium]